MWPFECIGPNGQTYLHNDNWKAFVKERELEYPHNWEHRRAVLTLCFPRENFMDIPGVTEFTTIQLKEEGFSTIFEPYPAHLRTRSDSDATEDGPSLNLFIEDGHIHPLGKPVVLFSTGYYFFNSGVGSMLLGSGSKPERFALYDGKYWRVWTVSGGGYGTAQPPLKRQPPPKRRIYGRSIDDEWL